MKQKSTLKRIFASLLAAAALTLIAGLGWLDGPDWFLSDLLYQHARPTDGEIVVVGMDDRALRKLGPMPWNRGVMADALSYLNADPETAPAVIGVDVVYAGYSADPEADELLLNAVADGGNVVLAGAATFGSENVDLSGEDFYVDDRAVLAWDVPFEELAAAAEIGHINAMADPDGIMRHGLLSVETPEGETVSSFARVIYERWCARQGLTPGPEPSTDADGFYYLPYTALPGNYSDGLSIMDLLEGTADPALFAGKIVLIGPYTLGMQDDYYTPIDRSVPMYGVEIQANAIDAFHTGNIPREVPAWPQLLAAFLICLAVLLFFWERKIPAAVAGWLIVCGAWIGACLLAYRFGLVLHVLWVPLFVTVLFVATVAVNYIRAQRARRQVTETFGRYVDPAIMKELLETGGEALELGGRMCEIAVLFVDIRGFTTMSESLNPPTVVEIINRYLTLTTDCIMRYHGTLDKFVGDCTMAFWNAPLPQEDPVYLACKAAMAMVEGAKPLGQELLAQYGRTVDFGVGVHVGPAVVGNIGAPRRMDYTAIGDTVNTSSRLESNAPGGTIYISRAVADALGDRAETTSLGGSIKLKGKAEGFEVLTLDALK